MTDQNLPPASEPAEPTVRELLLSRIDDDCSASSSTRSPRRPSSWHPSGPVAAVTL
jgi:hypothetical protein